MRWPALIHLFLPDGSRCGSWDDGDGWTALTSAVTCPEYLCRAAVKDDERCPSCGGRDGSHCPADVDTVDSNMTKAHRDVRAWPNEDSPEEGVRASLLVLRMRTQRAPRVPLRVALRVTESAPGRAMIAEAEDVSTSGIFVRCGEPFTVGTPVCVAVPIEDAGPIEVSGRVVRIGPGSSGQVGMGIMFTRLDERSCAALRGLVSARLSRIE